MFSNLPPSCVTLLIFKIVFQLQKIKQGFKIFIFTHWFPFVEKHKNKCKLYHLYFDVLFNSTLNMFQNKRLSH